MSELPDNTEGACTHCGLPLSIRSKKKSADGAFCCTGCYIAWHLTGKELEGKSDRLLARIVLSAFLSMGVMVCSLALYGKFIESGGGAELDSDAAEAMQGVLRLGSLALATPIVFLLGVPHVQAILSLRKFLSADALVLAGTLSAWAVSLWNTLFSSGDVYFETASLVLVLYTLGKWMDARARDRAHARIASMTEDEEPALRIVGDREERVAIDELKADDTIRVGPGEPIPVDGVVIAGIAEIDASRLTGEELSQSVGILDRVLAGSRVRDGELTVRARAVLGARVRDEMDRLLESALLRRAPLMRIADRAAGILLPIVLLVALLTAVYHWPDSGPERALMYALSVVLISCPCALGIATPLAVWTALGEAWKRGILVRSGDVFERLARNRRVLFDKTGTLTTGAMILTEIRFFGETSEAESLALAAALEAETEHPIGRAILSAWRERAFEPSIDQLQTVDDLQVLPGVGITGRVDGQPIRLCRASLDAKRSESTTTVVLERDSNAIAEFDFRAEPRASAREALSRLTLRGLSPEILTGDAAGPAEALARELKVPVQAELLPAQKVAAIREAGPEGVLFVGDGINDAAALATADVGASVSGASTASLEAAEVHLLRSDLSAIPDLLDLSRRTVSTARWNLFWAFAYNAIGLYFAATGRLTPVFAASAMVVSSGFVVLNSLRLSSGRAQLGGQLRT